MKATSVEILSMLGSWFSGIGAISAVVYAIQVNKPQIGARISDIKYYDNGEFTVDVFNNKQVNSHISYIRLVKKRWLGLGHKLPSQFSRSKVLLNFDNRQSNRIDITIKSGGHQQFKFSAVSLFDAYCELQDIQNVSGMTRMVKVQIAIYLANGNVKFIDVPKSQYQKIKNVMFMAATNRVNNAIELGTRNYPDSYPYKEIKRLQSRMMDDYEYAYRRQMYLQPPLGITIDDFWNNK